jgi:hypothetical protein
MEGFPNTTKQPAIGDNATGVFPEAGFRTEAEARARGPQ